MQSKVEKQGVARPSTLMLHCCTSTAQLALSADSWGSKLKAIICKLAHNFIGWTLTTATRREKLWKIKRQEQQRRSRRCTRISKILTASIWLFLAIILVFRPAIIKLNSCNSFWKSMRCYSGLMEPAVVCQRIEFWMCCDDKRSSEWIISCFTVISVKDLLSV